MKTTAAVLRELQDYYASLEIKPKHGDIANETRLAKATVTRYLNGTTKGGDPERVRAICIALERADLVDKLPARPDIRTTTDVWDLLTEQKLADRESNLEEVGYERQLRIESEKRYAAEIERIAQTNNLLIKRVDKMEEDKAKLISDNAVIMMQLENAVNGKRRYERMFIAIFMMMVLYFLFFDLPYPDSGVTELLINLFK